MSDNAKWIDVNEFPAYEIHQNDGIRRKGGLKSLKGRNWLGYPKVTLMKDGKKYEKRIHKLVGEHFVKNPDNLPIVNHKNSVRSDYRAKNLEWVDNSGNQLHRWKTQKEGLSKMEYKREYGLDKVAVTKKQRGAVNKANKAKEMLYKETKIEKTAGDVVYRTNSSLNNNNPTRRIGNKNSYGNKMAKKGGPINFSNIKKGLATGLILGAGAGAAYLAN